MSKQDTGTFWLIGGAAAAAAAYWWLTRQTSQAAQTIDTQSEAGTLPTSPNPYLDIKIKPVDNPGAFDWIKALIRPI